MTELSINDLATPEHATAAVTTRITPHLDHAVVNVAGRLDHAEQQFRRLGFQLTPRGHHSLGSSNHLAIFGENYLELLGYEVANEHTRKNLWLAPLGLTGLVWNSGEGRGGARRRPSVWVADRKRFLNATSRSRPWVATQTGLKRRLSPRRRSLCYGFEP